MTLTNFFNNLLTLYIDMAYYIFIGLLFVGILHVFVSKKWVAKHIGGSSFGAVAKASILGVPLPLCSCGVVPTAIYLKKSGASTGAVTSFLISTPQTGVDSIVATYGMMGPFFAIYRPIVAFISGITGGAIINRFAKDEMPITNKVVGVENSCNDGSCCSSTPEQEADQIKSLSLIEKIKKMFRYSFGEFLDDIVIHFIVGLIIAALITTIIPDGFVEQIGLSSGILVMLLMIVIGLPMYICSTSSIPIAIALMLKGISPGAAFVFLFVGPVTNAASLTVIGKTLGKKITAIYVTTVSILAILFGILLDYIVITFGISFNFSNHMSHSAANKGLMIAVAILFLLLMIRSLGQKLYNRYFAKAKIITNTTTSHITLNIDGMSCNHCVANIEKAIGEMTNVNNIQINLEGKYALIEGDNLEAGTLIASINALGYRASK